MDIKTIVIDGVEYQLVPVKKEPNSSITNDYQTEKTGELVGHKSGTAVPKVSDYRQRYLKHQILPSEVIAQKKPVKIERQDHLMDQFGDLIVGKGLEEEW